MLSLYSWCRNAGDPHFFDIALVGTPWRVGSRAMNLINPMSLSSSINPSSRKRIRSDNERNDYVYSDDEHESNLPKKPEVNYPRFIVLKPVNSHQPLSKLSPFAVAKSIQGRFGTVNQVKRLKDGSLLIEASRNIQAQHIMDTQTFLDIEVDAEAHRSLNSSKGVIRDYHQDLRDMTEKQIKNELSSQGVTHVSRFILKKDNKEIKTNTLFLTFDTHIPPAKLKIGYYIVNVQPYIPNPLRCFQCQKFGHSKKWCKNQLACWKCGSEGHDGGDCTAETVCCLNCKGDHFASSKSCPVWIQEKEIQRVKTEKSLSYGEARKLVVYSSFFLAIGLFIICQCCQIYNEGQFLQIVKLLRSGSVRNHLYGKLLFYHRYRQLLQALEQTTHLLPVALFQIKTASVKVHLQNKRNRLLRNHKRKLKTTKN